MSRVAAGARGAPDATAVFGRALPSRREGDQLRTELLAAAARLAAGPRPVTIPSLRAVARACGVSAPAVYRHFDSQAALTRALLTAEYDAFERVVLADDDEDRPPRERLRRLARAYVRWGLANPGMYQLLFESAEQLDDACAFSGASEELARRLGVLVTDPGAAEHLFAGLHGLVSLRIHKPHRDWATAPTDLIETYLPSSPPPSSGERTSIR